MKEETLPRTDSVISLESDDEIDLIELFVRLWQRKIFIIAGTIAFACLLGLWAVPTSFLQQKSTTRLKFKLNFIGIERNEYPNGIKFSTADITVPHIIKNVYKSNEISSMMTLSQFRNNLTVQKSDDGLSLLATKYNNLLSNKKLTSEQLEKFQAEYLQKKEQIESNNEYYLIFYDDGMRIPKSLQSKILQDVLSDWAVFTEKKRGIYLYQVNLIPPEIFDVEFKNDDFVMKIDMLRQGAERVLENIKEISYLPGALLTRTQKGFNLNLLEIKMRDLLQYEIDPLTALIRNEQSLVKGYVTRLYLKEQIYNLKLQEKEQEDALALLKDSIDGYLESSGDARNRVNMQADTNFSSQNSLIPQLGDNFLDRLVSMAQVKEDVKYRQEITRNMVELGNKLIATRQHITYYKDYLPDEKTGPGKLIKDQNELHIDFEKKYKVAKEKAQLFTSELHSLYHAVSRNNLRPEQTLYTNVAMPEFQKLSVHSVKKVMLICVCLVSLFFGFSCCLALLIRAPENKRNL